MSHHTGLLDLNPLIFKMCGGQIQLRDLIHWIGPRHIELDLNPSILEMCGGKIQLRDLIHWIGPRHIEPHPKCQDAFSVQILFFSLFRESVLRS
jgi:hypothetical protein